MPTCATRPRLLLDAAQARWLLLAGFHLVLASSGLRLGCWLWGEGRAEAGKRWCLAVRAVVWGPELLAGHRQDPCSVAWGILTRGGHRRSLGAHCEEEGN